MTDVIATRVGIYGGRLREVGERFRLEKPEDKGSWMVEADKAEGVPRIHERLSSPARAEVGPNEAIAYAEAGQLTTALNLQLKDAYSRIADREAEIARLEALLAEKDGVAPAKATSTAQVKSARADAKAAAEEAEKAQEDADFRASEEPEVPEGEKDEGEAPTERPTRRRRG